MIQEEIKMKLKLFLMKNYITIILIGCIAFLFWQNFNLKKDIRNIKTQIHSDIFGIPSLFGGGTQSRLSDLEDRVDDLEWKVN